MPSRSHVCNVNHYIVCARGGPPAPALHAPVDALLGVTTAVARSSAEGAGSRKKPAPRQPAAPPLGSSSAQLV